MHKHVLSAVAVAAVLTGLSMAALTVFGVGHGANRAPARAAAGSPASAVRSSRADAAGWETIKAAARLRRMALQPGRTSYYRSFAAYMGLSGLVRLHPILPGRCAVAVSYLYNNLLDLHQAYTGEDWMPLREAVVSQPSLQACAPRSSELAYLPPE